MLGASSSGKSSLVKAGVIPKIRQSQDGKISKIFGIIIGNYWLTKTIERAASARQLKSKFRLLFETPSDSELLDERKQLTATE